MFRCVHKRFLGQYVAFNQRVYNFKKTSQQFVLGTLLGPINLTDP